MAVQFGLVCIETDCGQIRATPLSLTGDQRPNQYNQNLIMIWAQPDNMEISTAQLWIIQATGQMKTARPVSYSSATVLIVHFGSCLAAPPPGHVMGLRVKAKDEENRCGSQIEGLVLMQLQDELIRLGLSSNFTLKVRNLHKTTP
ncbi:hypothetical protein MHYP_G00209420 [Metynnis hypsauchen]